MKTIRGKPAILQQCADVLTDESKFRLGVPEAVFYPESVKDVRAVVKEAAERALPITVVGGKTGITGGSVPIDGCYVICFAAMNRILSVTTGGDGSPVLTCEPGVTIAAIDEYLRDPAAHATAVPGSNLLAGGSWFYPPDPTETTAQLGGTVAVNASGARSFRYGATRLHVVALSVVLADGETATISRGAAHASANGFALTTDQGASLPIPRPRYRSPVIKNASGYFSSLGMHLVDLLVGSEGTLAILTGIAVRLSVRPHIVSGLTFLPSRSEALSFASFLRAEQRTLAVEYFDESSLAFIDRHRAETAVAMPAFPDRANCALYWEYSESVDRPFEERMEQWDAWLQEHGSSFDLTWSGFELDEMEKLKAFRHCLPELVNAEVARRQRDCPAIRKISTDGAVPPASFETLFHASLHLIAEEGLEYVCFGHLGDFHLHFNIIPRSQDELERALAVYKKIMRVTIEQGGTVSAEHGIGKLKVDYLRDMYGGEAIEEMRAIKQAFDPRGMLNPGNLFG